MKALALNLLSVVLVLLFFFGATEAVLRTTHLFGARLSFSHPDSVLGYRMTPHRRYRHSQSNPRPVEGRINAFGWRDHERTLAKEPGVYRVALLGDSQVESFDVELDSTFASITERRLSETRPGRVEVLTFGRSSFTQTEELILLRREVQAFDPDAVLVLLLPHNDINDVRRETTPEQLRPFFLEKEDGSLVLDTRFNRSRAYRARVLLNPWKQHSALVSLLVERYNLLRQVRHAPRARNAIAPARIEGALSLCTATPDPEFLGSYRLNKILLAEMAAICRARGQPFCLMLSNWVYRTETIAALRESDPTFDPDFLEDDLSAFADSLGIEFLGLQRPFRRAYERTGHALDWGHWNYEGHRLAADLLLPKLEPLIARPGARTR